MNDAPLRDPLPDLAGLEDWLARREASLGDVRPEADARVHWSGAPGRRARRAIVYLHGFSASRMETAPLTETLAGALDANAFLARLSGHGRGPDAMGEARMTDWIEDAALALAIGRLIGERLVVVGTSTGATLAVHAAAHADPELAAAIEALVLIAPNFGPKDPRAGMLAWPGARLWVPWIVGATRVVPPENDAHGRHWTTTYPSTALVPMMQLVRAVERAPLERVRAPVLAIWCDEDEVVDARRTPPMLARLRGAQVSEHRVRVEGEEAKLNPSRHVIAGDAFAPSATIAIAERILAFLDGG